MRTVLICFGVCAVQESRLQESGTGVAKVPAPGAAVVFDTCALFAGRNEIVIVHGKETYRLRLTRQNKLILTK